MDQASVSPLSFLCRGRMRWYESATHLEVRRAAWLGQNEVLHGQVQVTCAVRLDLLVALDQFEQLQAHQACHSRRGGGDGGDDPPSDAFTLQKPERGSPFNKFISCRVAQIRPT